MNTYILMSMMEDYLRVPERIRTIRKHATPTELVRKALPIGNKRSFINLAATPLHYLTGRELFVDLGENSLSDGLADQLEVLRFWREAPLRCAPTTCCSTWMPSPPTARTSSMTFCCRKFARTLFRPTTRQGRDPQVRCTADGIRLPRKLRCADRGL